MRVLTYDPRVEPDDSSVIGAQPWLTRIHESPKAGPDQQLHRSLGRMASSCPVAQFRGDSAAIGSRCGSAHRDGPPRLG
jgi:hypothetical protein